MNEELKKIIEECNNLHITEAFLKTDNILNRPKYHNIMLSLSGGADSDTMLDIISKVKPKAKLNNALLVNLFLLINCLTLSLSKLSK